MKLIDKISNTLIAANSTLNIIIIIVASAAAVLLLIPLTAAQLLDGMNWTLFDYAAAWILLFGAGLTYKLIARNVRNNSYRAAVGIAVFTGLLIIWSNLAVGIIGSEDNPANWMFVGVLAIGVMGAILARFKPRGMSIALFATASSHLLVIAIAFIGRLDYQVSGPMEIIIPNLIFIALWLLSALLFRHAENKKAALKM